MSYNEFNGKKEKNYKRCKLQMVQKKGAIYQALETPYL